MKAFKPKFLGKQKRTAIGAAELDVIPWKGGAITVELRATEFTSHCPVTGQPDFASLVVRYVPTKALVETKSFKLYLWGFRDVEAFNEEIVDRIATDVQRAIQAQSVVVTGTFNLRGGVGVTATATRLMGVVK